MRILGIDPGIAIVGVGIIDYDGNKVRDVFYDAITTHKDLSLDKRLEKIYFELGAIIDKYDPDEAAIEELFYFKNQKTVIQVAEARGVTLLCLKHKNLATYEYTPLQIKQAVTGYGRAEKKQMQEMVKTFLHLEKVPKPDDVADALAVALTHSASINFKDQFLLR